MTCDGDALAVRGESPAVPRHLTAAEARKLKRELGSQIVLIDIRGR